MRILVTGSRSWTDEDLVETALWRAWCDAGIPPLATVTLVHGACPTGADAIADRIARRIGMQVERHPADWERFGRAAGFRRNAEMVSLGADMCCAFIAACTSPRCREPRPHPSHGATHCAGLSTAAGIEVRRYTEEDRMRKIPTLFRRDPDDMRHVLPEVTPGCEWVLAGEGVATRKYDGTCVMFDGSDWWARREVKPGKAAPPGWVQVDYDTATGKAVGWEPIAASPFAKFWREAVEPVADFGALTGASLPPGTFELVGPKVNGNPERADRHRLEPHANAERLEGWDLTYESLREHLTSWVAAEGVEGVVWHHPDGRMAKLKVRDFHA